MKFDKKSDGHYQLDVTGYVCPHPQIYTKKALQKESSGDLIEVLFDNPSSGESIATMCEASGDDIVARAHEAGSTKWTIRKS